jgi:hypothetical protein
VEAAGQLIQLFRDGLDYAFILVCNRILGCGACYSRLPMQSQILVSAPVFRPQPTYESLQGKQSWPLFTPRRCHAAPKQRRVHRMSPVITLLLRAKATIASLL